MISVAFWMRGDEGSRSCLGLSKEDDPCIQKKNVKLRKFQKGYLVLKVLRGFIGDLRGKFRPT